jgi:hypothetical protein
MTPRRPAHTALAASIVRRARRPGVFLSLKAEFAKIGEAQTYHKGIIDVLYLGDGSFISIN